MFNWKLSIQQYWKSNQNIESHLSLTRVLKRLMAHSTIDWRSRWAELFCASSSAPIQSKWSSWFSFQQKIIRIYPQKIFVRRYVKSPSHLFFKLDCYDESCHEVFTFEISSVLDDYLKSTSEMGIKELSMLDLITSKDGRRWRIVLRHWRQTIKRLTGRSAVEMLRASKSTLTSV